MPAVRAGSQAGDGHHMPLQLPQHLQGLPAEHLPGRQSLAYHHAGSTLGHSMTTAYSAAGWTSRAAVQLMSCFSVKAGSNKAACGSTCPWRIQRAAARLHQACVRLSGSTQLPECRPAGPHLDVSRAPPEHQVALGSKGQAVCLRSTCPVGLSRGPSMLKPSHQSRQDAADQVAAL